MIGDPGKEMLKISINKIIYNTESNLQDCVSEDSFQKAERDTFESASALFSYSEYDFLDQVGVWTDYQKLEQRQDEVQALAAHK